MITDKPALVMPFYDPNGTLFQHLQKILPDIKDHFGRAYLTVPDEPTQHQVEEVRILQADDFFSLYPVSPASLVGDHFTYLYRQTAQDSDPEQVLHLCFPDRFSFAMCTDYRQDFLTDVDSLLPEQLPLIFQRSAYAWATHPKNYFELESFVTNIGQTLFGKRLDYAWCHLVIQAKLLHEIMPFVKRHDLSMVAEMILPVQKDVRTRDVDWLAWEDPFILGRDADELKDEREHSLEETQKRLSYVLPMVDLLTSFAVNGKD